MGGREMRGMICEGMICEGRGHVGDLIGLCRVTCILGGWVAICSTIHEWILREPYFHMCAGGVQH
jgi:hypothetical protein